MILVTGATGHIGNVLVQELARREQPVRALVLPGEDITPIANLPIEIVEGNVLHPESLERAMRGVQVVFHLAGQISILPGKDERVWAINVEGTKNMLDAARKAGVRRFIYTSSIHALTRDRANPAMDESVVFDPQAITNDYDRSKAEASLAVQQAIRQGLDAVILCPTGVIGPYDYRESDMGRLIRDWTRARVNVLVNGAFDFVDVRDVAQGLILASERGRCGESYILSGEKIHLVEILGIVQEIMHIESVVVLLPFRFARVAAQVAQFVYRLVRSKPRFTLYSLETVMGWPEISRKKAERELGYHPRRLRDSS
ncbi:MAG TPA: NAD-dependent epimerase/dehydratase family protein [Anaerolineaceae bacterium]|nr:NAD-dependent epimerase/dehydratase family protein [Anaerolineaceae bacterium]